MDKTCRVCNISVGRTYKILTVNPGEFYQNVLREYCGEPELLCGNPVCRICFDAIAVLTDCDKQFDELTNRISSLKTRRLQFSTKLNSRAKRDQRMPNYVAIVQLTPTKGRKRVLFSSPTHAESVKRNDMKETPT